jgi:3-deoxy-D-manno-octulosonic-acid transferase
LANTGAGFGGCTSQDMNMARWIYSCLIWLLTPALLIKLYLRAGREPLYAQAVLERFGFYGVPKQQGAVWLHAVSLGETRAAMALVKALRVAHPGVRFVFTHGTATGRSEGVSLLAEGDVQVWQPWDTPQAAQRFFKHFQPRLGVLIDTEVWPNLVAIAQINNVPVVLANARLSKKSLRKALQFESLARPAFSGLHSVLAQTEEDAMRLRRIGSRVDAVTGNLKFDAQPDASLLALGHAWRAQSARPVVLFAISRDREESALLDVLHQHPQYVKGVQWWLVPRHPQRFDEVAALVVSKGFTLVRRSSWSAQPQAAQHLEPHAVVLGDSLGEMPFYFGAASVCLLGGSFEPLGGQNLIEACASSCPVVMGPHTFNFKQAAELALQAQAGIRVRNMSEAVQWAHAFALQPDEQRRMAQEAALAFSQAHQGAVNKTVLCLNDLMNN